MDIKQYDLHSLRSCFGLVSQEPLLFNYSIRDNILYSKPTATDEDITEATNIANATDFIKRLEVSEAEQGQMDMLKPAHSNPHHNLSVGYDASCGAKGSKLSGG